MVLQNELIYPSYHALCDHCSQCAWCVGKKTPVILLHSSSSKIDATSSQSLPSLVAETTQTQHRPGQQKVHVFLCNLIIFYNLNNLYATAVTLTT